MDVHLRDLRYFIAVADEQHVTRAAERLYVSQPALSKQIRGLERQFGFPLFDRHAQGVSLTRQGAALLAGARDVVERWNDTEAAVRSVAEQGVLVVGIQTAIGRDLQRQAMDRFRAACPAWTVSLRLVGWDDPAAGLLDGSSDLAFCWLPVPDAELVTKVLVVEPRWVAVQEGHRLADAEEVPFDELLAEPFLALPAAAGQLRDFWLATTERQGRPPVIGSEVAAAEETFEAVAAGLGVALVAEGNAALYARPGVVCLPVGGLAPAEMALVWRRRDSRPAVRAFVDSYTAVSG